MHHAHEVVKMVKTLVYPGDTLAALVAEARWRALTR